MSWLLPSALAIAGVAGLAAIALHFIARSRPLAEPLPTARFVPQRTITARTRSFALSDLLLLFLRIAAMLAIGAAVAGPVFAAARGRVARVVLIDRSRSVASMSEARDSARSLVRPGDVVVGFDSGASIARSIDSLDASAARGSFSAGLAGAARAAVSLASRADSVELVVVSPLTADEIDDATPRIRAAWPGRARVVRTGAARPAVAPPRVSSVASANDAVVAGLSLMGVMAAGPASDVRLVRGRMSAADSAWVRGADRVVLHWPSADSSAGWRSRSSIDAIGAVASETGTIVARFPRLWLIEGAAIARWSDGEPAAVERTLGSGCVRDVAVLIDPASDVTLRVPFRRFVEALLAPCGGTRSGRPIDSAAVASFTGRGGLAPAGMLRDRTVESSRWTPWLLLAGAALLLIELAVRRSERRLA